MKYGVCSLKGLASTVLFLSLLHPADARAGSRVFDPRNNCATLNCSSALINGTYLHDQSDNSEPFTLEVFTSGNECVRLEVTAQGTDLEMVLVCPRGTVWRDDDGGVGLQPLIKAITPPDRGWCTLQVSAFDGEGVGADFTLRYGRYLNTNVNCSSPTPPALGFAPDSEKVLDLEGQGEPPKGPSFAEDDF